MKRRRWIAAIGAVVVCVAFLGTAVAADKVRVGKAQGPVWAFLPVDVGKDQGIFATYGLDVEILVLGGDAKVQQALAADSIDFGLGSGPGMAFAAKGSPAIAVAAFAGAPRNIAMTVRMDSPITNVADLKGKLIAVSTEGSLSDWLARRMSMMEGWGPDGVRPVPLGANAASVAALEAKQIDAMVAGTELGYTLEEKKEAKNIFGMDKYAPHFITHVVYARNNLVATDPDLVTRFLKGFFASIAFMKTHKDKTSEIATQAVGESPTVASKVYDYEISMLETDGNFDPQAIEALKQSFIEMGTLTTKPSNDQLFTTRFCAGEPLAGRLLLPDFPGTRVIVDLAMIVGHLRGVEVIERRAEAQRFGLNARVELGVDGAKNRFLHAGADHAVAVAAHQDHRRGAERARHRRAQRVACHQHAAGRMRLADVEDRRFGWQEAGHVDDRPQWDIGDGEGNDARRMAVDHGLNIGPRTINLAMNITLAVKLAGGSGTVVIDLFAVLIEHDNAVRGDEAGRQATRHVETGGVSRRADADMTEPVENPLARQNLIGDDEIGDTLAIVGNDVRHGGILLRDQDSLALQRENAIA